ncbi:TMEM175 family protein [Dactylosporangium sp. CA-092794]|uniref:TMEM175 family protein n=1 Tax=Dactylosporangium sp. CA-092794 TaxID=3239929 RepID=UPI003D8E4A12
MSNAVPEEASSADLLTEHLGPDGLTPSESQRQTRERLVFFSDAVVAIAMTLLALELPVPHGDTSGEVWRSFVDLLPRDYLTFTISFAVTAAFWHTHHRLFQRVDRADAVLSRLNIVCLLFIVLLPFASRVLGEDGSLAFGVIFYASVIIAVDLSYLAMVVYTIRHRLVRTDVAPATLRTSVIRITTVAAVFLVSIPIALINPDAGKYTWLVLIVLPSLRSSLRRRAKAT